MAIRHDLMVRVLAGGMLAFALSSCGGGGSGAGAPTAPDAGTTDPTGGGTNPPPITGSTAQPLRVRTSEPEELFNLNQRWKFLMAGRNTCRGLAGMPPVPDVPVTAEELKAHFANGEESLYSGDSYASYEFARQAVIGADCGVWQFTRWSAKASVGCTMYASGGSPLKMDKPEGPVSLSDESNGPTCVGDKRRPLHKETTVHTVEGYSCMYVGEDLSLTYGHPYSTSQFDRCLYAKQPFYNSNDRLPVTVTTRPDAKKVAAYEEFKSSPDALHVALYFSGVFPVVPELIEENASIDPTRFTRQAVLDWINQPQRRLIAP